MRPRVRASLVLLAGLLTVLLVLPGSFAAERQDDADLAKIKSQIRSLQKKLDSVRGRAKTTAGELEVIGIELDLRTRELAMAVDTRARIGDDLATTEQAIAELEERIEREKKTLSTRLAAMYRMGRISYLRLLLSMDSAKSPLEAIGTMSYLVSRDARAVESFEASRQALTEQRSLLDSQKELAEKAHADVLARQRAIQRTRRQKSALLAKLEREQASSARALEDLKEKADRLQRLLTLLYSQDSTRSTDDVRIEEFKGALGWPVKGAVVADFGRQRSERFATYTINNGIQIEAKPGSSVQAVYAGTVLYAQWFKGYGNLVIVDHGKRIFSLYGNTRGLRVAKGDRVDAGQVIAEVGESEDAQSGFLYFEMRENNQPVDPRGWLR